LSITTNAVRINGSGSNNYNAVRINGSGSKISAFGEA
jgi:hypothetical protein